MRGRLAWLLGLSALAALVARALGRRRPPAPAPVAADPRADELRQRLDESRPLVEEREAFEEGELPVDRVEAGGPDPDDRRRRVHDEGRAAVDEMRGDDG